MPKPLKPVRIWKQNYSPMLMGGDVHRPISTEVTPNYYQRLAPGIRIGVVERNGITVVFEASSKGVVGYSVEAVEHDFKQAKNRAFVLKQIEEAKEQGKDTRSVSIDAFFK